MSIFLTSLALGVTAYSAKKVGNNIISIVDNREQLSKYKKINNIKIGELKNDIRVLNGDTFFLIKKYNSVSDSLELYLKENFKLENCNTVLKNKPCEFENEINAMTQIKDIKNMETSEFFDVLAAMSSGTVAGLTTNVIANTLASIGTASTGTQMSAIYGAAKANAINVKYGFGTLANNGLGMAVGEIIKDGSSIAIGLNILTTYLNKSSLNKLERAKIINYNLINLEKDLSNSKDEAEQIFKLVNEIIEIISEIENELYKGKISLDDALKRFREINELMISNRLKAMKTVLEENYFLLQDLEG